MIKVSLSCTPWLFTIIYVSNIYANRKNLWNQLRAIPDNYNGSWLVGGDFNEVLKARDKQGKLYLCPKS